MATRPGAQGQHGLFRLHRAIVGLYLPARCAGLQAVGIALQQAPAALLEEAGIALDQGAGIADAPGVEPVHGTGQRDEEGGFRCGKSSRIQRREPDAIRFRNALRCASRSTRSIAASLR